MANSAWAPTCVTPGDDPSARAIERASSQRLDEWCEQRCGEVNLLSLVEAFHLAGQLEETFIDAARRALLRHASVRDEPGMEDPSVPQELQILPSELQSNAVTEPRVLARVPGLFVLWKPPGWSAATVDQAVGSAQPLALKDWLQEHFGHLPIVCDEGVTFGMVHRLDRFTSGALLWAPCYRGLYEARLQFSARKVCKEYLCLVRGHLKNELPFMIKAPILETESEMGMARSIVSELGKTAMTEVMEGVNFVDVEGQHMSMLKVRIHTGRTHQIRCHLSHEGHPLVGDPVYGGPTPPWCSRHWLHAWKLSLVMSSGQVEVKVPLPSDLRGTLERLRPAQENEAQRLSTWGL
ncbi:unnamed protein product [Effrenium voratum]|uniref:Pseudouridine synthase RsuA/RluA-like domain-containing protein n=1 Tax=Effrenium voratum TaxID=2562239 RepID=A0AA36NFV8_9DINO|nr:unnamed protein product [Effrenium voratum]CAJ1413962.1 unnamed protein product [Effrenium voratum]